MAPRTIRQLAEESLKYDFTPGISFRSWIHVARSMLQQAAIYEREEEHEEAYILYSRFADLLINALPKHPELGSNSVAKRQLKEYVGKVPDVFEHMGRIKGIIESNVDNYNAMLRAAEQSRKRVARLKQLQKQNSSNASASPSEGEPVATPSTATTATTNVENNGVAGGEEGDDGYRDTLSTLKRLRLGGGNTGVEENGSLVRNWSYPIVPKSGDTGTSSSPSLSSVERPPLPPKAGPSPPPAAPEAVHKSRCATEGGVPLRTVFLPAKLRDQFLEIAHNNTTRKLETCGILCGKLNRNAFFITHLVIPHQESTSDTCTTTNEHILFEYVDKNDLFILGWIHTHPTQSCFLSSIDLHTQNSYQIMLPEAVAIVCAPQHDPSWGIFRLTDPTGIEIIKKCPYNSTFHPHDETDLYRLAYNPGHVVINSGLTHTMKDLRQIQP
ncbi:hypothetical protein TRICI_001514 [Trichomonascus ciferrii]|uniref:Regulator of free ubiquitin chains 1 n=1 Tax=Trichomonascus ciferrii TaxID=44093 RepID=A0A642VAM2_9ASCO|nr:hypothetical protein TRICI_001514 [Trichomonascus ciferrii]